jgi:aspartate/methionine/tyrosine aminotransferase
MSPPHRDCYLDWARANAGRTRLCLRGSGVANRPLPCPLPPLPQRPAGPFDDLWHQAAVARAIGLRYGAGPEQVFVALGTSGANRAVLEVLLGGGEEPGELICERPAYDPLWRTGVALGSPVHFFERRAQDDWRLDPLALEAELSHQTRAVILTRPHNPSGVDIPETTLLAVGEMAEAHDLYVVVDEVYLDFVPHARPAFQIHPRLISTSSLTKVYGLSELRLGWVVAPQEIVAAMHQRRLHGEALLPTLPHAVALALWDQLDAWRDEARAQAALGASTLQAAVQGLEGPRLSPCAGTPFACLQGIDEDQLLAALEARGVGVTPGRYFDAPGCVRVGWTRAPEQLQQAATILREILLKSA